MDTVMPAVPAGMNSVEYQLAAGMAVWSTVFVAVPDTASWMDPVTMAGADVFSGSGMDCGLVKLVPVTLKEVCVG